jgi:hypothetical protein
MWCGIFGQTVRVAGKDCLEIRTSRAQEPGSSRPEASAESFS